MEKSFYEVLIGGEKLIDKDFMMDIFDGTMKKRSPLLKYLNFMFDNKQGSLVGSCKEEENSFPCYLLRSELFYPTCKDIVDNK